MVVILFRMDMADAQGWTPDSLNDALIAEITAEKAARKFTNATLGQRAGIDPQSVGRYLRREREINIDQAFRFADALDMKASELFVRAEARLARTQGQKQTVTDAPATNGGMGMRDEASPPPRATERRKDLAARVQFDRMSGRRATGSEDVV